MTMRILIALVVGALWGGIVSGYIFMSGPEVAFWSVIGGSILLGLDILETPTDTSMRQCFIDAGAAMSGSLLFSSLLVALLI